MGTPRAFSAMSAAERVDAILDRGTFAPLAAVGSDMPIAVGSGLLARAPVLVAFTDGRIRGGTIGVRESSILARLADIAATARVRGRPPAALIIGFDTGGVRVEEGPIGLAAASAVGVALARLTLLGVRLAAVISGPRGCFGAPAVMAALPERVILTADAHWGLTGPKLLGGMLDGNRPEEEALAATSAANRLSNGDAHVVVRDSAAAVRAALRGFAAEAKAGRTAKPLRDWIRESGRVAAALQARLQSDSSWSPPVLSGHARRRDLLRHSFRGQWKPAGPVQRCGLIHASLGTLGGHPTLGLVIGSERTHGGGVGIPEAAAVTDMIGRAVRQEAGEPATILTFLFCQGHAVDFAQERFGLHRALAECLRAAVAARLLGHPIVSVLGGGTYGAAYLALAAPSHRILAMRGTSVAPMAPDVLQAFEALRGRKTTPRDGAQLAELIPDIRMVESVIRLPRVLQEELAKLRAPAES